jgi:drug/metabolite transporter (DMT)-like permease
VIYLVFSALSSFAILIIFKTIDRLRVGLFQVIIINYAAAFTLGFFLNRSSGGDDGPGLNIINLIQAPWFYTAMVIGLCLIAMFFLMGISTQKAGISVTSIATKISVIIPMLFSILYYHETLTPLKTVGIVLALPALVCITVKKKATGFDRRYVYLPLLLFLGMGGLDALVKFIQHEYLIQGTSAGFTGACFFFAFVAGLVICLVRQVSVREFTKIKVLAAGTLLGISNFGSMFFLINALDSNVFDSSVVFGINNIAIVGLAVFSGAVFFKERLSPLNWIGVTLSIAAIWIFTHT